MASSSTVATCSGDASNTVNEDEKAMWDRLLQVESQIDLIQKFQTIIGPGTKPTEEIVIKAATSSKGPSVSCQHQGSSASFKSVDFELSNDLLKLLQTQQADSKFSSPRMCFFLSKLFVSDTQKKGESSCLKLFWRYSNGILDADLLLFLSKVAEYYSPSHGLESHYWTQRDHTLHSVSSSQSVKPLELIFPFSTRFETAKECLACLDLLNSITVDLNPDDSGTLASILSSLKSPEFQALHALKKEMELHGEVARQLEQLSGKQLHAFKDHFERPDVFFRTCQEEKRNVLQEALYKKVKCLASIEKANINRQVKLSSKDILKGIVQKAGSAFKELEGKLKKAQSSEEVCSKECTLCFSEFSKKRKRAWLDPCGHASACIDCATKAWAKKACCPWCNASIQKPISIPVQIFL